MDQAVMAESAKLFNTHIKNKWGDDATALLICNNLDAHVAAETKAICAEGKATFMYALPPTVTEAIQPIDAGFGRSVRCAIGPKLDEWLLTEENLEKWEHGMTAGESRILISNISTYCTTTMQTRIEEHKDYESTIKNDPIKLLEAIQVLMQNPMRARYPLCNYDRCIYQGTQLSPT
jgi:hypothetical protein